MTTLNYTFWLSKYPLGPSGNLDVTWNYLFSPLWTSERNSNHLVAYSVTPDLELWHCPILGSLTSVWPPMDF